MEDFVHIAHGPVSATVILKEIVYKGKGYIVVENGDGAALRHADFTHTVDDAADLLLENGAREVLMTPGRPIMAGALQTEKYIFVFEHEIQSMEVDFAAAPREPESGGPRYVPLEARGAADYRKLYNACFQDVPNSATYLPADVEKLLHSGSARAFFIEKNGATAGIVELSFTQEAPEINAFGIREELRGQGIGRAAMRRLLYGLQAGGFTGATLKVSSENNKAYRLYLGEGFVKTGTVSAWFRLA